LCRAHGAPKATGTDDPRRCALGRVPILRAWSCWAASCQWCWGYLDTATSGSTNPLRVAGSGDKRLVNSINLQLIRPTSALHTLRRTCVCGDREPNPCAMRATQARLFPCRSWGDGKGVTLQDRRRSASPRHHGAGLGVIDRLDRRGRDPAKVRVRWEGEPKERIGLILPAQACKARESHSPHAHHTQE
jgi:hypothetical protein